MKSISVSPSTSTIAGRQPFISANFLNGLKRGDRVITKSGMHGKIIEVVDGSDTCVLETMAGKIRYEV